MSRNKKILLAIVGLVILLSGIFYYNHTKYVDIKIIAFNDFHGAIEHKREVGASKFVYAIREETTPTTLIVSAGDNYNGEAMSNSLFGKPVSDIFKKINITASALGNHEFDWGIDKILTWEEDMGAPFVSANIMKDGEYFVKPYIITEIKGVKVAFVGLTTTEASYKSNRNFVKYLTFLDPVESAKKFVKEAKDNGADIIVLLTHLGSYTDEEDGKIKFENEELMQLTEIEGVDAIITAHYHQLVSGFINGIPVVQSLQKGRAFSMIDFYINKRTKKIKNIEISSRVLVNEKDSLKEDQEIAELIKNYNNQLSTVFNESLGIVKEKISYDKYKKSPLGDLFCDILKEETNSDIAMLNGGSITGQFYPGEIRIKDIYSILPFDNICVVLNLQGKYIKQMIDRKISDKEIGELQYSGVKKVNGQFILDNGQPLEDDKYYKVATNDFMVSGGDLYDFSNAADAEEVGYIRNIIIKGLSKKNKNLQTILSQPM